MRSLSGPVTLTRRWRCRFLCSARDLPLAAAADLDQDTQRAKLAGGERKALLGLRSGNKGGFKADTHTLSLTHSSLHKSAAASFCVYAYELRRLLDDTQAAMLAHRISLISSKPSNKSLSRSPTH